MFYKKIKQASKLTIKYQLSLKVFFKAFNYFIDITSLNFKTLD